MAEGWDTSFHRSAVLVAAGIGFARQLVRDEDPDLVSDAEIDALVAEAETMLRSVMLHPGLSAGTDAFSVLLMAAALMVAGSPGALAVQTAIKIMVELDSEAATDAVVTEFMARGNDPHPDRRGS